MKNKKYGFIGKAAFVLAALFLAASFTGLAAAAEWPSRPVTMIVPVPPGGSTDMGARLLAQYLEKELKQPFAVVNKTGAAGTVGGYAVASAKPDGYTLGYLAGTGACPEPYTYFFSAPYTSNDIRPIARVHVPIITVAVNGDAPWNTLKDLVEHAKKNPGMKFGHLGKSTTQYVVMTTVVKGAGLKMVDVPYDGDATMIPAILGGHIPVGTPVLYVIKSLIDAKKIKVLAVALDKRAASAPNIPTLAEQGYKTPYGAFLGLYGPKNLPDDIAKKINDAVAKTAADKEFLAKNDAMDMPVVYQGGAEFQKFFAQYKINVQNFLTEQGLIKK